MKSSEIEQRTNTKFCFKLGKMVTEIHEMLVKIYRDAALKNMNMRRVSSKFVSRLLSQEQKELRLSISLELLDRTNSDSGFFFYEVRSPVTNLGYTVTIVKRKRRVLTGKHRNRREQRKRINRNQM
jgi:hypothetical protein